MKEIYEVYAVEMWDEDFQDYKPIAIFTDYKEAIKLIVTLIGDTYPEESLKEIIRDLQTERCSEYIARIERFDLLDKVEQHYYDESLFDLIK